MTLDSNLLKYLNSTRGDYAQDYARPRSRMSRRNSSKGWSFAGVCWNCKARAGHLSIASIDVRGPLVCVFTAKSQIVCCKSFNRHLSRVSRRTQGGSLRAIDHRLVATTNNGSRYRSISTRRMTWWTPLRERTMHAPLACVSVLSSADLPSLDGYRRRHEICSWIRPPSSNANESFLWKLFAAATKIA